MEEYLIGLSLFLLLFPFLAMGIVTVKKPPEKFELRDAFGAAVFFGIVAVLLMAINTIFIGC